MSGSRIVYRDWIVELGVDPEELKSHRLVVPEIPEHISFEELIDIAAPQASPEENTGVSHEIQEQVRLALEKLTEPEREFVRQFYFMGKSYRRIAYQTGRTLHKLEALHKRVLKKLRKELSGYVRKRFGIATTKTPPCLLCLSPHRKEIDRLIRERDKTQTWKPVMKILRERYHIHITSPQLLIGHEKYH